MKLRLTQSIVAGVTLAKGKTDQLIADAEVAGLYLRVRNGAEGLRKSYLIQRRIHGRQRRREIGSATLPLMQVRDQARKLLAQITLGHDPQVEKATKRARAARTFAAAAKLHLAANAHLRPSTLRSRRLYLTGAYFGPLHSIPLSDIRRADIAARLSAIHREHSPSVAIAAHSAISSLLAWGVAEGWIDSNPVAGRNNLPPAKSRDRVLSDDELAAVWRTCGDDDFGRIVRLLILTGARRQEIGGMRWGEYDPSTGVWTLPPERAKNKRPHSVPLPATARVILKAMPRRDSAFVFGVRNVGFTAWSAPKAALDAQLGDAVAPWVLHDLRRTLATRLGDLGVEPHVIETALNHQSGHRKGVAGTYNRSPYERAVKAALARWADHVLALAEGRDSNIVSLQA
jgi:integrase